MISVALFLKLLTEFLSLIISYKTVALEKDEF